MHSFVVSIDSVYAILRAFVCQVLSLPDNYVLIETKTKPRPMDDRPYVTLYWLEQTLLEKNMYYFEQPATPDVDCTENTVNEAYNTMRFTVRGPNAYNLCSELRYAIESHNRFWDLWRLLGFSGVTNVTDLSAVYGGQVQQRSFIDLSFYACLGKSYPLAWFDKCPFIINGIQSIYGDQNNGESGYLP